MYLTHLLLFTKVRKFIQKVQYPQPSQNDSLEGELQAFLTDEDRLHTYDDLTKVNPVTPITGRWLCTVSAKWHLSHLYLYPLR